MNLFKRYFVVFWGAVAMLLLASCGAVQTPATSPQSPLSQINFFNVGHRGARGLTPENTIPSFEKAIEVGANVIEFDIHATRDHKIVVYHDGSFTPGYTLKPDGSEITDQERKNYIFYQMPYSEIRKFIIGQKFYKAFPEQVLQKTYAPLLTEMIDSIEKFTDKQEHAPTIYLLEIKSGPESDGVEQPEPEEFMRILMGTLKPYLKKLNGRLIIQSFDKRPLVIIRRDYPNIPIGLLKGDVKISADQDIADMGFTPEYYNPHFSFITPDLLKDWHGKKMKVMTWTVEKEEDIERMIQMGVDGIISDYPNRTTEVMERMNVKK